MPKVKAKSHPSVVLVFGESINDARAIAHQLEAHCPSLRGRIRARPKPTSLQRSASRESTRNWCRKVTAAAAGHSEPVAAVFVHRDSDERDPSGSLEHATQQELAKAGVARPFAAVPVQAIEAWWLLFPKPTESHKRSWKGALPAKPGNVEVVADPKSHLRTRTGKRDPKAAYQEADSPAIARLVAQAIADGHRPAGASASYERFVASAHACCPES